ncbi:hypothetical protein CDV31_011200 [Fusarium ambrosium]|uniref:CFEM domain-containing protein n=1 Tax=Fusarium ambrosium TaxID=131363 RepID=A0A428TIJ5_9HYPO|nr:hypothetical protein CDV31_011200 [Fusarium ambrosium]
MKSVLIAAALASAGALAQSPLPQCAQSCALNILASSGCGSTDVACVCKSKVFVEGYTSCVAKACDAKDAAAAEQYGVQLCGSAGVTFSGGGGAPATEAPPASSEAPEAPSAPTEAPSVPSAPAAPSAPEAPSAPYPPKPSEEVPPVVPPESEPAGVPTAPATPATPTAVVPTAGAGIVQVSNAVMLSVGLSMMLVLLN